MVAGAAAGSVGIRGLGSGAVRQFRSVARAAVGVGSRRSNSSRLARMDVAKLRAWYSHKQGLDGRLAGSTAAQAIEQTGWIRSLGSATPYLALNARAGISRTAADAAVAQLQIHELPAVRGCMYVLPKSDFALGLAAGGLTP